MHSVSHKFTDNPQSMCAHKKLDFNGFTFPYCNDVSVIITDNKTTLKIITC